MSKKKSKKNKRPIILSTEQVIPEQNNTETAGQTEAEPAPVDELAELNEHYAYVRRDVKKLLIVICILAVLMVGVYFLEIKSSVLTNFGNWVYKICNITI